MTEQPKHSPMGASVAKQLIACSGSVQLRQKYRERDEESIFALEGTAAHHFLEQAIVEALEAWELVGNEYSTKVWNDSRTERVDHVVRCDADMADAIQTFLDFIAPLDSSEGIGVEQRVSDPTFHRNFYGTVDYYSWDGRTLHIVDFKYGAGLPVDVEKNTQLLYYALGVIRKFGFGGKDLGNIKVVMTIVQPRANHPDGPVRSWSVNANYIVNWGDTVLRPAMDRAEYDTTLTPGEHCRFCVNAHCPALKSIATVAFSKSAEDAEALTDEELAATYAKFDVLRMYMKDVTAQCTKRALAGKALDGVKVVHGSSDRIFKAEAFTELVEKLGDDVYEPRQVKSPAQLEKLGPVAKDLVKRLAYKPTGRLTIAPASDKRQAVKVSLPSETFKGVVNAYENNFE